jgi:hypothetical protein
VAVLTDEEDAVCFERSARVSQVRPTRAGSRSHSHHHISPWLRFSRALNILSPRAGCSATTEETKFEVTLILSWGGGMELGGSVVTVDNLWVVCASSVPSVWVLRD